MDESKVLLEMTNAEKKNQLKIKTLMREIEHKTKSIAEEENNRLDAFKRLARVRLDDINSRKIGTSLYDMEERVRVKYGTFVAHCQAVQSERWILAVKLERAEQLRNEHNDQIRITRQRISALREQTRSKLNENAVWLEKMAAGKSLKSKIEAAEAKAEERENERDNKSKPYLADKLFRYLHERAYGTSAYKANFLIRWGDAFVAKKINYEQARQNFITLNTLPKYLRDHVEKLYGDMEGIKSELKSFYHDELVSAGIDPFARQLAEQVKELDRFEKNCKQIQDDLDANVARYLELTEGDDKDGLNAVLAILIEYFKGKELQALMDEAQKTPTPDDDVIVEELVANKARILQHRESIKQLNVDLREAQTRAEEIDAAITAFKEENYDGTFSNEDAIKEAISGILQGAILTDELLKLLEDNYSARPSNSSGHYWSDSSSSGFSFDYGSFGGSGFSSGGSFGGGGFSTGGGF